MTKENSRSTNIINSKVTFAAIQAKMNAHNIVCVRLVFVLCFLDFACCVLLLLFNAAHMREPTQGQPDSETFAFNVEAMFANFKRITGSFIHVFMYTPNVHILDKLCQGKQLRYGGLRKKTLI